MRISDWSSDVCSSDLHDGGQPLEAVAQQRDAAGAVARVAEGDLGAAERHVEDGADELPATAAQRARPQHRAAQVAPAAFVIAEPREEVLEHGVLSPGVALEAPFREVAFHVEDAAGGLADAGQRQEDVERKRTLIK